MRYVVDLIIVGVMIGAAIFVVHCLLTDCTILCPYCGKLIHCKRRK